jgi:NitT/TauT family transport system substrate-binding protein
MGVRRLAMAGAAALSVLGLGACGSSGSAPQATGSQSSGPVALKVGMGVGVYTAPLKTTAFTDSGLDLTTQTVTSGTVAVPLLLNGQLQFSEADAVGALTAISKGVPLVIVGAVTSTGTSPSTDNTGVLVKEGGSIKSAADLSGQKVGVNAIGGAAQLAAEAAIDKLGGDSSTIQWVELPPTELDQAVQRGTLAAAVATLTGGEGALGLHSIIAPTAEAMPGAPLIVWIASRQYAAQHPDVVTRFAQATAAADESLSKDPSLVRTVMVDTSSTPISPTQAKSLVLAQFTPATVQPSALQSVIDLMARYKTITTSIEASSVLAGS